MLEDFKQGHRIELTGRVIQLGKDLQACARPTGMRAVHADCVDPKRSTHLEELSEPAPKIQYAPNAQVSKPQHVLNVSHGGGPA